MAAGIAGRGAPASESWDALLRFDGSIKLKEASEAVLSRRGR